MSVYMNTSIGRKPPSKLYYNV